MNQLWVQYWWLIFPLMWFVTSILRMWSQHRSRKDTLELLRTYASQGKEPPAEVLKTLENGGPSYRGSRTGLHRCWSRVAVFASLALGFGTMAYLNRAVGTEHGALFVAVIMGALALGFLLIALLTPQPHDQ